MAHFPPHLGHLLAIALSAAGCLSHTYHVPRSELLRLAETPPEARTQMRVTQQLATASEPTPANRVTSDVVIVVGHDHHYGPGYHGGTSAAGGGSYGGGTGGIGSGVSLGSKNSTAAKGAKDAIIAVIVVAAASLVVAAATEAARYDGQVAMHPMHPVHLRLHSGGWAVVPVAQLSREWVAVTDIAVVTPREGPWQRLGRSPLLRSGLTYTMLGGYGTSVSATGDVGSGPLTHIQLGLFPGEQIGVQLIAAFGWRTNSVDATLFDARYALELDAYPLKAGKLHAGVFGNIGLATRFEDGVTGGDHSGLTWSVGAQAQLELTTFVALTARAGIIEAHGTKTREALIGLSVY